MELEHYTGIVKFYMVNCNPCRAVTALLERLHVVTKDINVENNADLAYKYGVSSVPTMIYLQDGKEVSRVVGSKVEEWVKQYGL